MEQSLVDGFVGILQFYIFSDKTDVDCFGGIVHLVDEFKPCAHVWFTFGGDACLSQHYFVEVLLVHLQGHFVN